VDGGDNTILQVERHFSSLFLVAAAGRARGEGGTGQRIEDEYEYDYEASHQPLATDHYVRYIRVADERAPRKTLVGSRSP
jgi:hypothetical protein